MYLGNLKAKTVSQMQEGFMKSYDFKSVSNNLNTIIYTEINQINNTNKYLL